MHLSHSLSKRCQGSCELCELPSEKLQAYTVPTRTEEKDENLVVLCDTCLHYIQKNNYQNVNYFHFLTGSIWSEISAIKVLSYQILNKLSSNDWVQDARDTAILSEEERAWANSENEAKANEVIHKDAYGIVLQNGDNVFLTDSLNVKGTNFTASKGTKVVKIRLVPDNAEQIEGKMEGYGVIVLQTKYLRKSN